MTLTVGVDPGLHGAIAYVGDEGLIHLEDMPVVDGHLNPHGVANLIVGWRTATIAIEVQQAMPRQGVASTFKTGEGYGVLLGVCAALERPVTHVRAGVWTRALGVGPDKEKHRRRAMDMWPASAHLFARVKDDGRADAALIAWWAWQQHTQRAAA